MFFFKSIAASTPKLTIPSATANTLDIGEVQITTTIDGKVKLVSEASIRRHLKLEDSDGISTFPNTKIFEQLALMGFIQIFLNKHKRLLVPYNKTYIAPTLTQKLFSNMRMASKGYTGVDILLFQTMLVQGPIGSTIPVESHHTPSGTPTTSQPLLSSPSRILARQETKVPRPNSLTHTNVTDEAASIGIDVRHRGDATTVSSLYAGQGSGNINKTSSMPHDSPLPRVHTLRSDEGRMQHNELMDFITKLTDKVLALGTYLQQTNKVYSTAFTKLIIKVKKLEKTVKSNKAKRRAKIVMSDDEDAVEDSSKQGRKIDEINQDPNNPLNLSLNKPLKSCSKDKKKLAMKQLIIFKIIDESSKKTAEEELEQESSKRQKTGESSKPREKKMMN
nr:hypothetical protein [Tanacetum cinerariifolium]